MYQKYLSGVSGKGIAGLKPSKNDDHHFEKLGLTQHMRTLKKNLAGQFSHRSHQVHLSERKMEKTRFGIKTLNGLLKKKERKKPHRLMQNIPRTGSRFSSRSTRQSFDLISQKSKLIKSRKVLKKKSNKIKTSNRPIICKPSFLFSR